MRADLQEAADADFVAGVHGDRVLVQPEERPRVVLFGLQPLKDAVVIKEKPPGALCRREVTQEHQQ